jgi:hypothetical protein
MRPYLKKYPSQKKAGGVSQVVERLPSKCETTVQTPVPLRQKKKKWARVRGLCPHHAAVVRPPDTWIRNPDLASGEQPVSPFHPRQCTRPSSYVTWVTAAASKLGPSAGDMAQVTKHLPRKPKALGSIPSTKNKTKTKPFNPHHGVFSATNPSLAAPFQAQP